LRRFFRAEMPQPWPAAPEPPLRLPQHRDTRTAQQRRWFKHGGRLAVAAAVTFFLIGYLALASAFPQHGPSGPSIRPGIGQGTTTSPRPEPVLPGDMNKKLPRIELIPPQDVPLPGGGSANMTGEVIREGNNPTPRVIRLDLHRMDK
jgi:hypothetical protein